MEVEVLVSILLLLFILLKPLMNQIPSPAGASVG
jgi:hypothetical protein